MVIVTIILRIACWVYLDYSVHILGVKLIWIHMMDFSKCCIRNLNIILNFFFFQKTKVNYKCKFYRNVKELVHKILTEINSRCMSVPTIDMIIDILRKPLSLKTSHFSSDYPIFHILNLIHFFLKFLRGTYCHYWNLLIILMKPAFALSTVVVFLIAYVVNFSSWRVQNQRS